jgi:hypothetical protein
VTWGEKSRGGDSSAVASVLTSGVHKVIGSSNAFAALKSNGSVVAWGAYTSNFVSASVGSNVKCVIANEAAFR